MEAEKSLLIADDNPFIRDLRAATLSSDEYAVMLAGDGEEAWGLILERRPTAVLVNVNMLGHGGLQLAGDIQESPEFGGTHVLLVSGVSVEGGPQSGTEGYLARPFSPSQLLEAVGDAMGRGA